MGLTVRDYCELRNKTKEEELVHFKQEMSSVTLFLSCQIQIVACKQKHSYGRQTYIDLDRHVQKREKY